MKMRNRIGVKDYLLIGLSIIDGIMREFQDPGGFVSYSYKNMYGFVPGRYKQNSFDNLLTLLKKNGYVTKSGEVKDRFYSLTEEGAVLARKKGFLSFYNRKWDSKIWVIIFDIEEVHKAKRDKLREVIRTFGFAMWQKSVWVCPYKPSPDFYKYLEEEKIKPVVHIFNIPVEVIGNLKAFGEKVWKISSLASLYTDWIKDASNYIENIKSNRSMIGGGKSRLVKKFYEIVLVDPFLPEEFLPVGWVGKEARRVFKEINSLE